MRVSVAYERFRGFNLVGDHLFALDALLMQSNDFAEQDVQFLTKINLLRSGDGFSRSDLPVKPLVRYVL